MIIGLSILALVTVVPVKIGAELFGAANKSLMFCIIATIAGTVLSLASINYIGGLSGIFIAFISMTLTYSKIFKLPFFTSLKLTFVIIIVQVGCIQALVNLGFHILT